jgi:preprotein translocase subunit SecD
MKRSLVWRALLVAVITFVAIILVIPSITDYVPSSLKEKIGKINLGLDLQGGIFLRLQVELEKAVENTISRYSEDARTSLREKGIPVLSTEKVNQGSYRIVIPPGEFIERARNALEQRFGNLEIEVGEIRDTSAKIILTM